MTLFRRLAVLALLVGAALAGSLPVAQAQFSVSNVAGPWTIRTTAAPVVTASSAYAANNAVGGLLTFANAVRLPGYGGEVRTAVLRDASGQQVAYDLFLFDQAPAAPTDKTAVALSSADLAKAIGVISFAAPALGAVSTMGVFTATNQGLAFRVGVASSQAIYGILVVRGGTPTYATTASLSVTLVVFPD